jgi:hypothetical protein
VLSGADGGGEGSSVGWTDRAADRWQRRPDPPMIGRSKPLPLWSRLVLCLFYIAYVVTATVGLFDKRGAVIGVVAAVVYGLVIPVFLLAWRRMTAWSKRYQMLFICTFSLIWAGVLFRMVAYQTKPAHRYLLVDRTAG